MGSNLVAVGSALAQEQWPTLGTSCASCARYSGGTGRKYSGFSRPCLARCLLECRTMPRCHGTWIVLVGALGIACGGQSSEGNDPVAGAGGKSAFKQKTGQGGTAMDGHAVGDHGGGVSGPVSATSVSTGGASFSTGGTVASTGGTMASGSDTTDTACVVSRQKPIGCPCRDSSDCESGTCRGDAYGSESCGKLVTGECYNLVPARGLNVCLIRTRGNEFRYYD